jgi:hypothetical protein
MSNFAYRPDAYGHTQPRPTSGNQVATLTAGAVSTTAQGTIVPTTAAGASPTVTFATGQVAVDECGTFTLSPVTGGGSQATGAVAQVFFTQAFEVIPKGVVVNMCDNASTTGAVAVNCSAQSITASGFTINVSSALTTAHTYLVSYIVKA